MATTEKKPDSDIVLMIDIETLSLRPTAFVTQIGFCVGNVATREMLILPTNIWMDDNQPTGHIDPGTVRWWAKQDPKVSAVVFEPPEGQQRFSAREVFDYFRDLVEQFTDVVVYGSPAMFDLPILTAAWQGRKPWRYNFERDMMTLYKLLDPLGQLQPPANDMHHDAASDAGWQMQYLFNLHARLREMQDAWSIAQQPTVGELPGQFSDELRNPGT